MGGSGATRCRRHQCLRQEATTTSSPAALSRLVGALVGVLRWFVATLAAKLVDAAFAAIVATLVAAVLRLI